MVDVPIHRFSCLKLSMAIVLLYEWMLYCSLCPNISIGENVRGRHSCCECVRCQAVGHLSLTIASRVLFIGNHENMTMSFFSQGNDYRNTRLPSERILIPGIQDLLCRVYR